MSSSRRKFVRDVSLAAAGWAIWPKYPSTGPLYGDAGPLYDADRKVRLAIIGTGLRGQSHLALALRRPDTEVVAICDVDDRMLKMADEIIGRSGKTRPAVYSGDVHTYRK